MSTLPWRELGASESWRSVRWFVSLAWVGCAWLLALPALAQPRIDWQASAGCPSGDEGRAQIEQLLRAPLTELAIDLSAAVRLRRDSGSAFAATIEVRQAGVTRTRVLHSGDCSVLAHVSAVIVALAIDPTAHVDEPSSASETRAATSVPAGSAGPTPQAPRLPVSDLPPTAEEAPAPPRSTPIAVATPAPTAAEGGAGSRLQPVLGAALGLDAGSLPKLAPALALIAGLETSWSRAALRLTHAPAQRATASDLPGASGRVGLAAAALEAGLHWYLGRLELSSLAGLEAGVFTARGSEGVSDRATKHPLWLGGYLAGRIALLANASFTVGLRLDGIIALRRPSFVLRGDLGENRTLHRPNPVSGRGWLELELRFPQ